MAVRGEIQAIMEGVSEGGHRPRTLLAGQTEEDWPSTIPTVSKRPVPPSMANKAEDGKLGASTSDVHKAGHRERGPAAAPHPAVDLQNISASAPATFAI